MYTQVSKTKEYVSAKSKEQYQRIREDGRYQLCLQQKAERYRTDEVYRAHVKAYNRARYRVRKSAMNIQPCCLVIC